MRKDSPLVACSIATMILLVAGGALVPSSAWRAAAVVAHLAPTLASTATGHGSTAARAAVVGILATPGLLQEAPPAAKPSEPQVKVCRREVPRTCNRPVECPRQALRRLHLVFPIDG
jgi:hypothetical protein